jgi:hypothetical protein
MAIDGVARPDKHCLSHCFEEFGMQRRNQDNANELFALPYIMKRTLP